jgi:hypothetical protein
LIQGIATAEVFLLVVESRKLNINLRGRVKFPIGGKAHEPDCGESGRMA